MRVMIGRITGTVMRMVLTSSRAVPRTTYSTITASTIASGESCAACTHTASSFGRRVSTMKRAKMKAPTMMKNSIALEKGVAQPAQAERARGEADDDRREGADGRALGRREPA